MPYRELVALLGPQRTVLRIDPIIPVTPYLQAAYQVLSEARVLLATKCVGSGFRSMMTINIVTCA